MRWIRSHLPWHAPHSPADFAHHAVLRDADPRLFDAVLRRLRQRLYDGRAERAGRGALTVRVAVVRQGDPRWLAPCILVLGAAVCFVLGPSRPALCAATAILAVAMAAAIARTPRKHIWLVAHPCDGERSIDLWIAGDRERGAGFTREFERLVAESEELQAVLTASASVPVPPAAAEA